MLRNSFSVAVNRALVRRSFFHLPRSCSLLPAATPTCEACFTRNLSSNTDVNREYDSSSQSLDDRNKVGISDNSLEEKNQEISSNFEILGPPESAVKRALKDEPDEEWDVVAEYMNVYRRKNLPEEFIEPISTIKDNFYDWQWKIMGTARLLEAPLGNWTRDQWFSAENILLNGWSDHHCIRAVVLQFALLHRTCHEQESLKQQQLQLRSAPTQQNIDQPSTIAAHSNDSDDSIVSLMNGDFELRFGKVKMLSRFIGNWRCVYMVFPEILRQYHLSPQDVLDNVLNVYYAKYGVAVSEKVFRHILVSEISHQDNATPEFSQKVLTHCLDLYDAGIEQCFPTTPMWNCVLYSWINAGRQESSDGFKRVVLLMDEMKVERSRYTYRMLQSECLRRGTEQAARDSEDILRQMYKNFLADSSLVQPDISSFVFVLDTWAKSKSPLAGPRAEQIYEQLKTLRAKNHLLEKDSENFDGSNRETRLVTSVLLCYVSIGSAVAAERAEQFCIRAGISPDIAISAALVTIYANNKDLNGAERIWNDMASTDTSASLHSKEIELSASVLLNAYAQSNVSNKIEKAAALFNRMKSNSSINLDTPCYNAFLKVLMTGKNTELKLQAHEVIRQMRENKLQSARPNVISYNTIMNGWAQQGDFERTSEVLRLMYDDYVTGNSNAKPDVMAYNTLLTAYLKSNDKASWTRAAALLEYMKKISLHGVLNVQPDVYSMSTSLACLSHCKDNLVEAAATAEVVLNEMRESYLNGNFRLQPNSYCYNSVMDVWARQGNPERAEAIFLQMCKDFNDGNSAARPSAPTYNILLKAWSTSRSPEAVERSQQIIEQMSASKVKPDVRSYTTLISCYGRSMQPGAPQKADKVLRFMDELYEKGILKEGPSQRTFAALRRAWEVSKEIDKKTAIASLDQEMTNRFSSVARK